MTDAQPKVRVLRENESPFEELAPGRETSQNIEDAGISVMGGGFFRQTTEDAVYSCDVLGDEVMFVYEGELEVITEDGSSFVATQGEAILVAKGQRITFRGTLGTKHFWVIYPPVYE